MDAVQASRASHWATSAQQLVAMQVLHAAETLSPPWAAKVAAALVRSLALHTAVEASDALASAAPSVVAVASATGPVEPASRSKV
jgi:hypothetical protein